MKTPKELYIAGLRRGNEFYPLTFPDKELENELWEKILEEEGIVQPTPPENCISDVEIKPEVVVMTGYLRGHKKEDGR